MSKIPMRIEVRAVLNYEVDPLDYDSADTSPERIAAVDLESAEDDVYLFLDNEDTQWDIKVAPRQTDD